MSKPTHKYQGPGVMFQGTIGAQKRLASAKLEVKRIGMYRGGLGFVWEADTDDGKRWVSRDSNGVWTISRTPPTAKLEPLQ
jgi:hypothetical protein